VLTQTAKLTVFVYFIMIGASVFSLCFYGLSGDEWLHHVLLRIPGEQTGFVLFSMVLIFILGCFLDFFEIALIVVPMLLPTAAALGIDPLWFGLLISLNLQISFLTPPFGFALFYLRSVAPQPGTPNGMSTGAIYTGAAPYVLLNVLVIAVVMAFPSMIKPTKAPAADGGTLEIRSLPEIGNGGAGNLNRLFK
jgi:TRAP-type mannitol/chloroaromatic compound transport system permease large subunit